MDGDAGAAFAGPASPGLSAASPGCRGITGGSEETLDPTPDGSVAHARGAPASAVACTALPHPRNNLVVISAPRALLTDEDAEGLRGSEVPQEVPVPFQPSLLCGEKSPALSN